MFGRKKIEPPKPRDPVSFKASWPDGTFLTTESNVYFIKAGKKFRLYSPRVFASWKAVAVSVTEDSIKHVRPGGVLGFRDSTLIKDISDGRIYLIAGSKRRHVTNPDVLEILDYPVVVVSHDETTLHEEGQELNGLGID